MDLENWVIIAAWSWASIALLDAFMPFTGIYGGLTTKTDHQD